MQGHSDFPLFYQSAIAIFVTLLVLALLGWMMQPKAVSQNSTVSAAVEITSNR